MSKGTKELVKAREKVPAPEPAAAMETLTHPLTFFLSVSERREVLKKLAGIGVSRSGALLRALGVGAGKEGGNANCKSQSAD